jgi:hypothetical protein
VIDVATGAHRIRAGNPARLIGVPVGGDHDRPHVALVPAQLRAGTPILEDAALLFYERLFELGSLAAEPCSAAHVRRRRRSWRRRSRWS